MSAPDTSEYTTEAGSVYLQAGQSYAVTSKWPIVIIAFPEGGGLMDAQMVAFSEQVGGSFEFTSTVTGHGLIMAKTGDNEQAIVNPIVRAVFNRAPGASSSGTGGSSSSSAPTPPWVAYNADRSEITAANLAGLTNGEYMFQYTGLISFSGDLSALTDGNYMFFSCGALASFISDLPALVNGNEMFFGCYKLAIFISYLPVLTNGDAFFYNCKELASFICDLPALSNGKNTFGRCFKLTIFSSDLPSLSIGDGMFNGCKLDKESSLRILNTIPAYTSDTHSLTLGMAAALNGDADITAALTAASNKGWTVTAQYN